MARRYAKQQETKKKESNLVKIGALWLHKKNGKTFMSGRIELDKDNEMRILVFKNDYKEEDKHPDFVIVEPQQEDNREEAEKKFKASDNDIPF